jgi:chemotaxis signal transduction protein/CheY-like chemotaxis protein
MEATKKEILLETGTNEFEILELFIYENVPGKEDPEPNYFGVNVAKVMQVIESPNLTHPESAPNPCFLGTISLRNMIVPVLDLAVWLGVDKHETDYEVVIVTEFSQSVQGFLVSGVTEIHRVGWERVMPPHDYLAKKAPGSLVGMVEMGDHFIQLLDLEHILTDLNPDDLINADQTTVRSDKEYRALIADDSPTIRLMLQKNLQASGFSLLTADNGQDALAKIQDLNERAKAGGKDISDFVDIVIADIEMPLMDGFTMTKKIKEDSELQKIPVILYSSIITKELRHKGDSVRADEQISKPEMSKMAERAINLIQARGE